jgi:hypothetical protein
MVRALLLIFVAALVGSCATTGAEKVAAIPSGKTVTIVSLIGNNAYIIYTGFTIFENEKILKDVSSWSIDDFAVSKASNIIKSSGRFSYNTTIYDVDALKKIEISRNPFTGSISIDEFKPYLSTIVEKSGADIILLITAGRTGDFVFGTDEGLQDFGVYRRNVLGITRTAVFCNIDVTVVDGRDFHVIGHHNGDRSEFIDDKFWAEPIGSFSKDQLDYIRKSIETLIEAEIRNALLKIRI